MPRPADVEKYYLLLWGYDSLSGEKAYGLRAENPELPFTALDLHDELAPYIYPGYKGSRHWYTVPTNWYGTKIHGTQVNIEPFLVKVSERGGIPLKFLSLEEIEVAAGLRENTNRGSRYQFNPGLAGIANLIRFYREEA